MFAGENVFTVTVFFITSLLFYEEPIVLFSKSFNSRNLWQIETVAFSSIRDSIGIDRVKPRCGEIECTG
jgi:hypothetical protein